MQTPKTSGTSMGSLVNGLIFRGERELVAYRKLRAQL